MRHTRNRQLNRKWVNRKWKMPAIKIEDVYNDNALVSSDRLDKSFKWHRDYNGFGNFVEFEAYVHHGDDVIYKPKLIPGK